MAESMNVEQTRSRRWLARLSLLLALLAVVIVVVFADLHSIAMLAAGFTFPLIVHLVVAHPTGQVGTAPARILVTAFYSEALVAAAALALFRNPYSDPGCLANCNVNIFLVRSLPRLARAVETFDRWFTATAALALIAMCTARLARSSLPARNRLLPVVGPAMIFAAALIARAAVLQVVTVEYPFNPALFTIFVASSCALALLAAGQTSGVARARSERRAVARIAASLDEAPAPGGLRSALASALRDPGLQIAYWLPSWRRYVDASGEKVSEPAIRPGRSVTRLTRNGGIIAAVTHSDAAPDIDDHIGPAIRLGLENERLQAELLAQLTELRASRARIVQAADAVRRRLERDLHDGAQQQLLALSYDIRLARAAAQADGNGQAELALAGAVEETAEALEDLRDLAHGIYPAVLADAGIAPAVATLADTAPLPVDLALAADRRYPAQVEAAAYFAVAEILAKAARAGADHATVSVADQGERLVVTVKVTGAGAIPPMVALADRTGALGGSLITNGDVYRAEIPCG